ncbi:uncharacterized protein P174DRAFT_420877 [Aspergillus novofumigatus IBT 16806]|uniref:Uncharacterized protein n=1 Tax=Aspergillus novofumigatus (strain IBT 16806) TaxID=1392255 RepID=A0A2I1C9L4_ASPN1|nr:uncharacterized protein P174DRAFT_420877 [Aspergillus novofumigatus IBT 16806]PKX94328.1 hypothetical protein P174DRAFT_420877 [Aspergillus novofumigatus IBT 16806]
MPTPHPERPEFYTTVTRAAISIFEAIAVVTSALSTMINETLAVHTSRGPMAVFTRTREALYLVLIDRMNNIQQQDSEGDAD